ncbi:MAG: twin-arginine translocase TatA/TatE family subunit [Candidatus Cloacimonadota bacterium]|jgi:sec-independent protein translocase protein TatA|nr:MAG: twin-arginine translocase TatA/TatE family subunit [Candidatus Cloacimonadota bacterium]
MLGGGIGWQEITIVLVIVLLLFGAKKIPEVMHSFGKGIKEFKKGMKSIQNELEKEDEPEKEKDKTT